MASGTFTQIYIQIVFAVKGRQSLIKPTWEEKLYKYITGIITNKGQKLLAINGMPDHIHILIGMKPNCNLSDLVREIKKSSNNYINEKSYREETQRWWYTHKMGRRSFMSVKRALPNMFHYLDNEKIPKSTNSIESFFGHMKGHLNIHRGLSITHRKQFIM